MHFRLAVIVSPRSRHFRHHPQSIETLRSLSAPHGLFAVCGDRQRTLEALEVALDHGVEVIAVAGGDGSLGHVIDPMHALWGARGLPVPALALLRGGTMNTVANGLGLSRGRPERLLGELLSLLDGAPDHPLAMTEHPTLDVAGRIGFLFGTGVFHSFLDAYYAKGRGDPTVLTAAMTIGHTVASIAARGPFARALTAPVHLTVEADGERWPETRFLAVNAGTVSQVGLGFRPFHLADRFQRAFHLMGLTGAPASVAADLPRVWLGRGVRPSNGRDQVARAVTLTPTDGKPVAYMVDGDLFTAPGPLPLRVGPQVRVVRL